MTFEMNIVIAEMPSARRLRPAVAVIRTGEIKIQGFKGCVAAPRLPSVRGRGATYGRHRFYWDFVRFDPLLISDTEGETLRNSFVFDTPRWQTR